MFTSLHYNIYQPKCHYVAHNCIPIRGLGTCPKKMTVLHAIVTVFCATWFVISKPVKHPKAWPWLWRSSSRLHMKLWEVSAWPAGSQGMVEVPCSVEQGKQILGHWLLWCVRIKAQRTRTWKDGKDAEFTKKEKEEDPETFKLYKSTVKDTPSSSERSHGKCMQVLAQAHRVRWVQMGVLQHWVFHTNLFHIQPATCSSGPVFCLILAYFCNTFQKQPPVK